MTTKRETHEYLMRGTKEWDKFITTCHKNNIIPVMVVDIEKATGVTGCDGCEANLEFAKKNNCDQVLERVDSWDIIGVCSPIKLDLEVKE